MEKWLGNDGKLWENHGTMWENHPKCLGSDCFHPRKTTTQAALRSIDPAIASLRGTPLHGSRPAWQGPSGGDESLEDGHSKHQ